MRLVNSFNVKYLHYFLYLKVSCSLFSISKGLQSGFFYSKSICCFGIIIVVADNIKSFLKGKFYFSVAFQVGLFYTLIFKVLLKNCDINRNGKNQFKKVCLFKEKDKITYFQFKDNEHVGHFSKFVFVYLDKQDNTSNRCLDLFFFSI